MYGYKIINHPPCRLPLFSYPHAFFAGFAVPPDASTQQPLVVDRQFQQTPAEKKRNENRKPNKTSTRRTSLHRGFLSRLALILRVFSGNFRREPQRNKLKTQNCSRTLGLGISLDTLRFYGQNGDGQKCRPRCLSKIGRSRSPYFAPALELMILIRYTICFFMFLDISSQIIVTDNENGNKNNKIIKVMISPGFKDP